MPEWKPGVLGGLLKGIEGAGIAQQRAGMLKIAAAIEALAKANLAKKTHPYHTKSPAGKGEPPALVSGTGRRSIGHQYMPGETDVRVGTLAGVYPPAMAPMKGHKGVRRTGGGKTPSSKYLLYQETLPRFDHPFLKPAANQIFADVMVAEWWHDVFDSWPRLL